MHSVKVGQIWTHLSGLYLTDPNFPSPGRIDLLLNADIISSVLRNGWWTGPPISPVAIEIFFGWVLSGSVNGGYQVPVHHVSVCHPSIFSTNDLVWSF